MGRQTKLKVILAAGVFLVIAVAGVIWYFRFQAQTPEYSLDQIRQAVEKHDTEKFHRYVDVSELVEHSYEDLVDELLDTGIVMPEDARIAVGDLVQMMKAPILMSFEHAIDQYVKNGNWEAKDTEGDSQSVSSSELLARTGLNKTEFREVKSIQEIKDDEERVIANISVYQAEAEREFVFEAVMEKTEDGYWRVEEIQNFKEFLAVVGEARRARLEHYIASTKEIMEKHDRIVREAELQYGDILSAGSLGKQETRDEIKTLMQNVIQKDWEERKQELFSLEVPEAARTLHRLRLRICDLHIGYARGYALWMTDKKSTTVREADAKLKEAKTLEQEAKVLSRRIEIAKKN